MWSFNLFLVVLFFLILRHFHFHLLISFLPLSVPPSLIYLTRKVSLALNIFNYNESINRFLLYLTSLYFNFFYYYFREVYKYAYSPDGSLTGYVNNSLSYFNVKDFSEMALPRDPFLNLPYNKSFCRSVDNLTVSLIRVDIPSFDMCINLYSATCESTLRLLIVTKSCLTTFIWEVTI